MDAAKTTLPAVFTNVAQARVEIENASAPPG
jgi:hypothetical protein